jgi:Glycosyltransferase 61
VGVATAEGASARAEGVWRAGWDLKVEAGVDRVEEWVQSWVLWPKTSGLDTRVRTVFGEGGVEKAGLGEGGWPRYRASERSTVTWLAHTDQYGDNAYLVHNMAFDPVREVFVVSADAPELPQLARVVFERGALPQCEARRTLAAPWIFMTAQTAHNMYHVHNDNLLPLYRALDLLNLTHARECAARADLRARGVASLADPALGLPYPCDLAAGGGGGSGSGSGGGGEGEGGDAGAVKSVPAENVLVGEDVVTLLVPSADTTSSVGVLASLVRHLVPRVLGLEGKVNDVKLKKLLGSVTDGNGHDDDKPLCLGTALVGRMPRMFRPTWERAAPYAARRIVPRFVRTMLHSMQLTHLWARPIPKRPSAVFLQRASNEMRYLDSEPMLVKAFQEVGVTLQLVDPAKMSAAEQVAVAAGADILLGVHGAALAFCLYLRPGSVCVEIRPHSLPVWESFLFSRFTIAAEIQLVTFREDMGSDFWKEPSVSLSRAKELSRDIRAFTVQVLFAWAAQNPHRF